MCYMVLFFHAGSTKETMFSFHGGQIIQMIHLKVLINHKEAKNPASFEVEVVTVQ